MYLLTSTCCLEVNYCYKPHCCLVLLSLELHEVMRVDTLLFPFSIASGFTFANRGPYRSVRDAEREENALAIKPVGLIMVST